MPIVPHEARVDRLRGIPIFQDLSDASLARVAACMTEFEAPAGYVLIQPHAAGQGMFVVEDGDVVVERPNRPDVHLGPGQFVGELALLSQRGKRVARARVGTPSVLLALSREDFEAILEEEPRIAVSMLRTLADRMAADAE
jgi:CRP-like cAMP-binding protein